MISITLDTTVYGVKHANAIHIGGITDGNTPIAEIRNAESDVIWQGVPQVEYAIFTGEIFASFSEALNAHVKAFESVKANAVEFIHDAPDMTRAIEILGDVPRRRCQDWQCQPTTHSYK